MSGSSRSGGLSHTFGAMAALPGGTVTFLFTDIEGSTRAWHERGEAMGGAVARHDELVAGAVAAHGGTVVKSLGDGAMAVFSEPALAVAAAVEAQRALTGDGTIRVRVGLHTGVAQPRDGDYLGATVNRAARVMSVAHGGQILVSGSAAAVARDSLPEGVVLVDLGEHRLRDIPAPEHLFQVVAEGLEAEFPPPASLGAASNNLPAHPTSFVGREVEAADVDALVQEHRLVTLTGVGGCGKTRLAVEVAFRSIERFADGACFTDLTPIADPDLVTPTVMGALAGVYGVRPGTGGDVEAVVNLLAPKRTLLVLDNCEHLIDAVADLVDAIVASCPEAHLLVTSRETLEIEGEHAYRVPSLAVDATVAADADAVRLFHERVRSVRPDFEVSGPHLDAVVEICRRLDGLPLALELAASRVSHLTPEEILERLDDRFRLLTGRQRRRVQRQQTLQATMDWSWDLLNDDERALLARLAVFAGGWSLPAAEAVCGGTDADVVDLLGALVDKSLVTCAGEGTATRYGLLETVRLYAQERLVEAGEAEEYRARHCDWYLRSRAAWSGMWGSTGDRFDLSFNFVSIDPDLDNLRGALEWAWSSGDAEVAGSIAMSMLDPWMRGRYWDESAQWFGDLLARRSGLPRTLSADLALGAAHTAMVRGAFDEMRDFAQLAVDLGDGCERSPLPLAFAFRGLRYAFEDPRRARADFECARELARGAGMTDSLPWIETCDAGVDLVLGDIRSAVERLEEVWREGRTAGFASAELGLAYLVQGRFDEALALAPVEGPDITDSFTLGSPGMIAAVARAGQGAVEEANARMVTASEGALRLSWPLVSHVCLGAWVAIALAEGDAERASELLAVQRNFATRSGWRSPAAYALYKHHVARVRTLLDPDAARRARDRAAGVGVEDALLAEMARARASRT